MTASARLLIPEYPPLARASEQFHGALAVSHEQTAAAGIQFETDRDAGRGLTGVLSLMVACPRPTSAYVKN